MSKNKIYKSLLDLILEPLGDQDFQLRAWDTEIGTVWTDYDEATMSFQEWCEPILENPKSYDLDKKEIAQLRKLHEMIESYDERVPEHPNAKDHKRILGDPEWHKIQQLANQVYHNLKKRAID